MSEFSLPQTTWRKCSTCKKDIPWKAKYYECSVSTCTGQRTGYVFCSLPCWEVHLPGAKHRDAGAIEKTSPSSALNASGSSVNAAPKRIIISNSSSAGATQRSAPGGGAVSSMSHEVLVVVSKMKQYIRDRSEMNTAEEVNQVLSEMIRRACDQAIESARQDGRKTVMARDFK